MAVFLVLSATDRPDLAARIQSLFPGDNSMKVAPGQWLVSANTTSQGLSEHLGVTNPTSDEAPYGYVMIVGVLGSYYGFHSKTMWEWIALKTRSAS